jgi:hypothetical protein
MGESYWTAGFRAPVPRSIGFIENDFTVFPLNSQN